MFGCSELTSAGSVFLLAGLNEAEVSAGLQQRHDHHPSQKLLHRRLAVDLPSGGRFADTRGDIEPLHM